jgi:hypothetical protein
MGLFWLVWFLGFMLTSAVMLGAWSGPFRSVSNLSRWAMRLHIRPVPAWLSNPDADRWAFRSGLGVVALLLVAPWLVPLEPTPNVPANPPAASPTAVAPATPEQKADTRPSRHLDTELQNAIRVHVPKTKRVRMVVLKDDAEADQFSWEIDAFLRTEGYTVVSPRLMFAMAQGEQTPVGTSIYPDQKDPDIVIVRVGLNDR